MNSCQACGETSCVWRDMRSPPFVAISAVRDATWGRASSPPGDQRLAGDLSGEWPLADPAVIPLDSTARTFLATLARRTTSLLPRREALPIASGEFPAMWQVVRSGDEGGAGMVHCCR